MEIQGREGDAWGRAWRWGREKAAVCERWAGNELGEGGSRPLETSGPGEAPGLHSTSDGKPPEDVSRRDHHLV